MTLTVTALADCPAQPWQNGGGLTRPLLAWPQAENWCVRISVADITQSGPFSPYPGVQRWFCVLEGEGVALHFGPRTVPLGPQDAPLAFDGADAPGCTLLGGPTRDLNLMLRGARSHGLQPVAPGDWVSPLRHRAVFTTETATLHTPHGAQPLPALSLAWATDAAGQPWRLASATASVPRAWWLDWEPS